MGFLEDLMNDYNCAQCKLGNKDGCMKCTVKEGFRRLKNMDMNNVIIILIILVVLMYMDIIPNPFKSKVNKQHLQYFFF
jgi:hypothetical protein